MPISSPRRGFLQRLFGLAGASAAAAQAQPQRRDSSGDYRFLPRYARAQNYKSLKQSSFDRTGGNADRWPIAPGATQEVFNADGPGVITHIWFTIAAQSRNHLKEIVLRAYWDGNAKPSIETPVGDFFGLNLGQYFVYQSAFLNCSSIKALNCYFAMPFRKSARITATNEGEAAGRRFLFQYRLPARPVAARRRPVLPCAVPPGDAEHRRAMRRMRRTESRRQEELRLRGDARPRPPDGRDARRAAEHRALDGRRRRHDLRRRRNQARHHRHRLGGLLQRRLGFRRPRRRHPVRASLQRRALHRQRRNAPAAATACTAGTATIR